MWEKINKISQSEKHPASLLSHCKIGSYENRPTGIHSLWNYVDEEWNKISVEVCQKLIETIPKRIQTVIEAKGGHTKY